MTIKEFYSSRQWKLCRQAYKKSVGGLCEECYKKGIVRYADEVHHIKKLTDSNVNDPEVALNFDNLMALCEECHDKKHRKNKRYKVDEWGRVIPLPQ